MFAVTKRQIGLAGVILLAVAIGVVAYTHPVPNPLGRKVHDTNLATVVLMRGGEVEKKFLIEGEPDILNLDPYVFVAFNARERRLEIHRANLIRFGDRIWTVTLADKFGNLRLPIQGPNWER